MAEGRHRPSWVEIDLSAIEHNARVLAAIAAPAELCAVVKADAYGHGAVEVAGAALAGGATSLAVAIEEEGVELREAGIDAPVLVLAEPVAGSMAEMLHHRLVPTLYTPEGLEVVRRTAAAAATPGPVPVEVKIDTGMHRVGADPARLVGFLQAMAGAPELALDGLWTHLAVADEPESDFTGEQLRRFAAALSGVAAAGLSRPRRLHAANTAGAIAWPESRLDVVRCGIGIYGCSPSPALAPLVAAAATAAGFPEGLRPALSWISQVGLVRELEAGERLSYGLLAPLPARATVATVPLGYADGIPRAYFSGGGEVLVNGSRRRLAGTVTMDQVVVDCGADRAVAKGDEVVLIGRQGAESITADDWAGNLDTVNYEVLTRIGPRVPRRYKVAPGPASG
ncbi:MAG: alanine racemase [Acidimicrobiales bacterium]